MSDFIMCPHGVILICGSRNWGLPDSGTAAELHAAKVEREALIERALLPVFRKYPEATYLNGDCHGPDRIAGKIIRSLGGQVAYMPVSERQWEVHKKKAGPLRNRAMVRICDVVIAFLAKGSRGTTNTLAEAGDRYKPTYIVEEGNWRLKKVETVADIYPQ